MNRLANASSPYLRQHADNPVDWWPWCDEAFEEAKRRNVPIFLSIGYATCHWCHVMAHESFESDQTAALMNRDWVNIKLDREERPDLDAIYMAALQATQGNGGWPMSVFLDHEKRPFFLATYLPPENRFGRPSFTTVLTKLKEVWDNSRNEITANATAITEALERSEAPRGDGHVPDLALADLAYRQLAARFDATHGGLGTRPKFPTTHVYDFLMRYAARGKETHDSLAMVSTTLQRIHDGGIHDHVGGGFHRYSTDQEWLLPHFEKMLYDQAQILATSVEAWQCLRDPLYRAIGEDILRYLSHDLRNPEGGFYSGEDADSEGEEGKFYVWTEAEIDTALADAGLADHAAELKRVYGVTAGGNWEGKTILTRGLAPGLEDPATE
ncbi:MAG: thioredoxin domain-containing protein, partial [Planctomycetes bacterium]|nr:thioredoxin domain-containing protein [Planctomycetota bacterium]